VALPAGGLDSSEMLVQKKGRLNANYWACPASYYDSSTSMDISGRLTAGLSFGLDTGPVGELNRTPCMDWKVDPLLCKC
jgi:hypothetical protein